jgi:hypothetical protein
MAGDKPAEEKENRIGGKQNSDLHSVPIFHLLPAPHQRAMLMSDMNLRYQQRLDRYTTAMRNEQPDRVPIRPFVAEFTGVYAGYTCQEMAHDYANAFAAARKCAADFDWDAIVPNMLATWTGMTQAMGLRYYMIPGIDVPANVGHQYLEPSADDAWMKADEYDALIEDPTGFLYSVWLPRVARPLSRTGGKVTFEHNLSLIKGAMAMMQFFQAWGVQEERLRNECGTRSARFHR